MVTYGTMLSRLSCLSASNRVLLSGIARALYDNSGQVSYSVNQIAFYSAPVIPQSTAEDEAWQREAETWFRDWAKKCDFLGRAAVDFESMQSVISNGIDLDGDIGAVMTDEAGWPQLLLIDGYRIGDPFAVQSANEYDGVICDAKGRVTEYKVATAAGFETVSASVMTLVRDPAIGSPYRAVSPMRRGANDIRDARDITAFQKLGAKHAAALLGVIEGGYPDDGDEWDTGATDAAAAADGDSAATGVDDGAEHPDGNVSRADMLGGDIPALPPGKKFVRVEANRPNPGFSDFHDTLVGCYAAGLDLPPAFFLDQKLTGPNLRAVNSKAQRKFLQRQNTLARFVSWVWVRVIGWAIDHGQLRAVPGWERVRFQRPAQFSIDVARQASEDRADRRDGLVTLATLFGGQGLDWVTETDQTFVEDDYIIGKCIELARRRGMPVELILSRHGFTPAGAIAAAASPPPDQADQVPADDAPQDKPSDAPADPQQDNPDGGDNPPAKQ